MKKIKILSILHYPPPIHGAAMVGKYIRESEVINTTLDVKYINLSTSVAVDEIGKGGFKKWWRYFKLLIKSTTVIFKFEPDLVYLTLTSHGLGFYKDAVVALVAKCLGYKIVYHFHNKGVKDNQDQWFDNLLYKIVFRNSEVILLSKHLYNDIEKYVSKKHVHYCPNGIPDVQKKIPVRTAKNNVKAEILFLSNLIKTKGMETLLEACVILRDKKLNFKCTIIGGEGDVSPQELKEKIKIKDLQNEVFYLGKKYGREKEKEIEAADIFAFPTYYPNECFPLVLLEAMQFSLPIVSTFEGGIPDIVENTTSGFLVRKKDAEALANKLEFLINNPKERNRMGKNAKRKYEKEFTISRFENRFTDILSSITQNPSN